MNLFHDEEDGKAEPIPGLPAALPEGEAVQWQGRPSAAAFAVHVFHVRFVAAYFGLLLAWRLAALSSAGADASALAAGAAFTVAAGCAAVAILAALSWLMARSTIYPITNKRLVLRYGVAIRKYVNLPFTRIGAVAMRRHGAKSGSIALHTEGDAGVGYLHLWPHARPMRFSRPEPMMRGLGDVDDAAYALVRAMKSHAPESVTLSGDTVKTPKQPLTIPAGAASAT